MRIVLMNYQNHLHMNIKQSGYTEQIKLGSYFILWDGKKMQTTNKKGFHILFIMINSARNWFLTDLILLYNRMREESDIACI